MSYLEERQQPKKLKGIRAIPKMGPSKKQKRYSHYDMRFIASKEVDDTQFVETLVLDTHEVHHRALVAGPKQPPQYK